MSSSVRLALAMGLGASLCALAACGAATAPQDPAPLPGAPVETQQTRSLAPYFLPPSAQTRAVYQFTASQVVPGNASASFSTSGTSTFQVLQLGANSATLQRTTTATLPGRPTPQTDVATMTIQVEADGSVTTMDGGMQARYPLGAFTAAGADLIPAEGADQPAIRARLEGTETVTVPAGTYQTVRIREGVVGEPGTVSWYAAGVGLVRQQAIATFSIPVGENQVAEARTSYEVLLQSFEP